MLVLLTGGTGVIGRETVEALLRHGHRVRILSRGADRDAQRWEDRVEPWPATVTDEGAVRGSADACEAIVHIAGIVREEPPASTFESVNVEGTRLLLQEAERAGVRRCVYVSSLGANRGSSDYHRSKRAGEAIAREFSREWVIVRPGNVYGPGDEVLAKLLEWVRTSPAVPVIGGGHHPFQPIWVGDAAAALVAAVERKGIERRVLEVAGPDRTTLNELLDRMVALTDRSPPRIPIPAVAVSAGIQIADALGVELPIADAQLRMLLEENVIADDGENALTETFGLVPTSLDEGLRRLADAAPEQLPSEGFGPMQLRVFAAERHGTDMTPAQLIAKLRANFSRLMPSLVGTGAERGTPSRLYEGATLTLSLPVRGHIQVRVAEVTETDVTLLTLRGHPLAGAVRFSASGAEGALRFEVQVYDRAASMSDFAMMALGGSALQGRTWEDFVRNVLLQAGGSPVEEVVSSSATLGRDEAERIQRWLEALALRASKPAAEAPPRDLDVGV
jgi:nucleoside-diphosphate-sugar epimerase